MAEAVVNTSPSLPEGTTTPRRPQRNGKFAFGRHCRSAAYAAFGHGLGKRVEGDASAALVTDGAVLTMSLQMSVGWGRNSKPFPLAPGPLRRPSGGEHLSSTEVSSLPLNARDFSKLLLLAAGTMTDANGAANFTQQFAVNGQRGATTVFATDGFDTTDPEMGGATFSNFNVDAIQEVQSNSGVMPAEIGHGAASYTNVVTKSGTNQIHGSLFEFVRNAAFDARNYFDPSPAISGRQNSSVCAQRIWIYQRRADCVARDL